MIPFWVKLRSYNAWIFHSWTLSHAWRSSIFCTYFFSFSLSCWLSRSRSSWQKLLGLDEQHLELQHQGKSRVQRRTYVEPHRRRSSFPSRTTSLAHTMQEHFRWTVPMCRHRGARGCSHLPWVSLPDYWGRVQHSIHHPISSEVYVALGDLLADRSRDSNKPSRKENESKSK
jgi:hypothetical protein